MDIEVIEDIRCALGEGPLWDAEEQALYWVDSLAPAVFRYDWANRTTQRWDLPGDSVGSLCVRASGGLMLAMGQGFYGFDPQTGTCTLIAEPLAGMEHVNFNDGKVDRAGRFVAGGVHGNAGSGIEPQPVCSMYGLNADLSVDVMLGDFACFNGPCFSPDDKTLYVNGRGDMAHIEAFAYDSHTGRVGAGRTLIEDINPDGTTVDAEGFLWSAQWDDNCVLRIAPDGTVERRIDVPGQVVSSVMFGGPNMDTLFMTTLGKHHWGTPVSHVDAGAVLMIRNSEFTGLPEPRFAG